MMHHENVATVKRMDGCVTLCSAMEWYSRGCGAGDQMRLITFITNTAEARKILKHI